jgi:hypothetical protein
MIDWRVLNGSEEHKSDGWYFPSFPIQEYLLPQLNVGFDYLDEYGDTTFQREDCIRLKGNIAFILNSGWLERKVQIQYETFTGALVILPTAEIQSCLVRLREAADTALAMGGVLKFFGD